jgi:hypothetical protein
MAFYGTVLAQTVLMTAILNPVGIFHNDLHAGNIIVVPKDYTKPTVYFPDYAYKVDKAKENGWIAPGKIRSIVDDIQIKFDQSRLKKIPAGVWIDYQMFIQFPYKAEHDSSKIGMDDANADEDSTGYVLSDLALFMKRFREDSNKYLVDILAHVNTDARVWHLDLANTLINTISGSATDAQAVAPHDLKKAADEEKIEYIRPQIALTKIRRFVAAILFSLRVATGGAFSLKWPLEGVENIGHILSDAEIREHMGEKSQTWKTLQTKVRAATPAAAIASPGAFSGRVGFPGGVYIPPTPRFPSESPRPPLVAYPTQPRLQLQRHASIHSPMQDATASPIMSPFSHMVLPQRPQGSPADGPRGAFAPAAGVGAPPPGPLPPVQEGHEKGKHGGRRTRRRPGKWRKGKSRKLHHMALLARSMGL